MSRRVKLQCIASLPLTLIARSLYESQRRSKCVRIYRAAVSGLECTTRRALSSAKSFAIVLGDAC